MAVVKTGEYQNAEKAGGVSHVSGEYGSKQGPEVRAQGVNDQGESVQKEAAPGKPTETQDEKDKPGGENAPVSERSTEELLSMLEGFNSKLDKIAGQGPPAEAGAVGKEAEDPEINPANLMKQIEERVASGEINPTQAFKEMVEPLMQMAARSSQEAVQGALEKERTAKERNRYIEQNPDFLSAVESEEFQKILEENPVFNNVAAYERMKRATAESELAETKSILETLRGQKNQEIDEGSATTDKVGQEAGGEMRQQEQEKRKRPRFRHDDKAATESMMGALQRARSSG